jgi:hypothetical protein
MRTTVTIGFVLLTALIFSTVDAQQDSQWVTVKNPSDLRDLVSDSAMDAKGWVYYLRADGKMIYLNRSFDSLVFREWTIKDNGELCSTVYGHPDKVVECLILQRSSSDSNQYRVKDDAHGASLFRFVEPPQKLVDALIEKTGMK